MARLTIGSTIVTLNSNDIDVLKQLLQYQTPQLSELDVLLIVKLADDGEMTVEHATELQELHQRLTTLSDKAMRGIYIRTTETGAKLRMSYASLIDRIVKVLEQEIANLATP